MSMSLKQTAKTIITENQYMTLGSVGEGGQAWVAPLAYAFDRGYNLYFMSLPGSRHVKNMMRNPTVSVAIFDSRQGFGEGVGLQLKGEASGVPARSAAVVFKHYFGRKWPFGNLGNIKDFEKFFRIYKYRFYKVKPVEVWLNDPRKDYDARVRVRL